MQLFNFKTDEDRVDRIKAAGQAEGILPVSGCGACVIARLSGKGEALEAARLRERVANLELELDFFRSKLDAKLKAFTRDVSARSGELERDMNRDHFGPIMRGPEPDDDDDE